MHCDIGLQDSDSGLLFAETEFVLDIESKVQV